MKKIVMRAVMSPLDPIDPCTLIEEDAIGGNSGNMIFPFSLFRTLLQDDTQIDTIQTSHRFTDREVWELNEKYDCFVIPLANAFRPEFERELVNLTRLIDRLTIPCVVVGVGVQAGIDDSMDKSYPFDRAAGKFIKSVLRHSSMVGVRGEVTAAYLKKLGFAEEKDFTVIGCPSMFLNGKDLPVPRTKALNQDSRVCVNRKPPLPSAFHRFMDASMEKLPNHYFLPQNLADLMLLYAGVPISLSKHKKFPGKYPKLPSDDIFLQDRVRAFTNVPSWMAFLREAQFSFGSRIHGNIMAVQAGIPCFIFAPDSRVRELAEYHQIPNMWIKNMKKGEDIFEIYAKADFCSVLNGHEQRFEHYIQFLNKNGLDHVYNGSEVREPLPFDRKISGLDFHPPMHPLFTRSYKEQAEILAWYDTWLTLENRKLREKADGICKNTAKKLYRKIKEMA